MAELWARTLTGLIADLSAAVAAKLPRAFRAAPPSGAEPEPDPWAARQQRCEQAVRRAERAVDAISSARTRRRLRSVVRRMDAELPDVSALAELGRGLDDGPAARRVAEHLDGAVVRFGEFTGQLLETVAELVDHPRSELVDQRTAALREQFPLTTPFSAVLRGQVHTSD